MLLTVVLTTVILGHASQIQDDTWRHMALGRLMVQLQGLPRLEPFAIHPNNPKFIDFSWLSCLVFYGLYKSVGLMGMKIFASFVVGLSVFVAFWSRNERPLSVRLPAAMFLTVLIVASIRWRITPRPEIFSLLIFSVLMRLMTKLESIRFRSICALVFSCLALWQNLHATAQVGAVLVCVSVAFSPLRFARKCILSLLAIAALFLNPWGAQLIIESIVQAYEPMNRMIGEFIPLTLLQWSFFRGEYLLFGNVLFLVATLRQLRLKKIQLFNGALANAIIMDVYALSYGRGLVYGVIYFAHSVEEFLERLFSYFAQRARPFVLWAVPLTLAVCVHSYTAKFEYGLVSDRENLVIAADYLLASPAKGPILNDFAIGGYLMWNEPLKYKLFVDNRSPIYSKTTLPSVWAIFKPGVIESMDRIYNFDAAILGWAVDLCPFVPHSTCGRSLYANNLPREKWALIAWASDALVYLKRNSKNADYIARHEYRYLQPEISDPETSLAYMRMLMEHKQTRLKLKIEIERAMQTYPGDWKVQWYAWAYKAL
jgi:hypothetical protein